VIQGRVSFAAEIDSVLYEQCSTCAACNALQNPLPYFSFHFLLHKLCDFSLRYSLDGCSFCEMSCNQCYTARGLHCQLSRTSLQACHFLLKGEPLCVKWCIMQIFSQLSAWRFLMRILCSPASSSSFDFFFLPPFLGCNQVRVKTKGTKHMHALLTMTIWVFACSTEGLLFNAKRVQLVLGGVPEKCLPSRGNRPDDQEIKAGMD